MTRTEYVKKMENRRLLLSTALGLAIFAIPVLVFLVLDALSPKVLVNIAGPIRLKIGSTYATESPKANIDTSQSPELTTTETDTPNNNETSVVSPPPAETKPIQPLEKPQTKPNPVEPKKEPEAKPMVEPKPITQTQRIVRGSEAGNAHETTFAVDGNAAGWNFRPEFFLYMPLPSELESWIYESIKPGNALTVEQRKKLFSTLYTDAGNGVYRLSSRLVPFEKRPDIWLLLEDAGYDIRNAEYKTSFRLSPLELRFNVSPATALSNPELGDIRVSKSSGNPGVDEAIMYVFKMSSFLNSTGTSIRASFVYRFY